MYTKLAKKMLPFNVLDILQKYTDENHRLSQRDIEKYLSEKYDMVVDRRSVRRSITDLMDMGIDIQYNEIKRKTRDERTGEQEDQTILTDFYLERDFSDCEIRLLIDELLDSKYIPTRQRRELITKLEGLSSIYFRKSMNQRNSTSEVDNQLFYTIDIIDDAISNNSKVRFFYKKYYAGTGNKVLADMHEYTVTPYDMHVTDGYYLLTCDNGEEELSLRMDYISEICLVDEAGGTRRPCEQNLSKRTVKFATIEKMLPVFVERFDIENINIEVTGNDVFLYINVDEKTAVDFAVKHSDSATIMFPDSCRKKVIAKLREGLNRYNDAS